MGLSGKTYSETVESGREYCRGRKRPANIYREREVRGTFIGG